MAVYGLHSITGILGPAKKVSCYSGISDPIRIERAGPRKGRKVQVGMDDNTLIFLDFGNATFAMVDSGYCTLATKSPSLELYGSRGTISVSGSGRTAPIEIFRDDLELDVRGWGTVEMEEGQRMGLAANVAHMIDCILEDKKPIISGEHARHVIEIMTKCYDAAREGRTLELETTF
jgi:predicted dehydrogenase